MNHTKKIIAWIALIAFLSIASVSIYKWIRFDTVDVGGILFSCIALSYFFNWLNWGNHVGGGEKDEVAEHIETQSAKIGYYVLMVLSAGILFMSEGTGDFKNMDNYPLVFVVGLTFIIVPITEFIYSKRYKS